MPTHHHHHHDHDTIHHDTIHHDTIHHDTIHHGHAWVRGVTSDDRPSRGRRGRRPGFRGDSPGSFFGHGPRAGRGDVRAAILGLLAESPMHGYQIIKEIEQRSGGVWTPSPGSVYPTLQHLEDEDLVTSDLSDAKKVFSITEAGRAAYAVRGGAKAPWEEVGDDVDNTLIELRDGVHQVVSAVHQIARGGTAGQVSAAKRLLADTRRALYRILAEEDGS
jgi:DNA-binding PadR family transcriptional regulator